MTDDRDMTSRDRRAIFWCAAAFALVGVIGLVLFPPAKWIWITVLVIALTAIPQGFVSTRRPRGERRQ